jgi:hypothetical protein
MLLCGGKVTVFPQEIVASKTVYPEDGRTSRLQNQGTRLSRHMASHATTPRHRVTTMRTSNLCSNYVTLCKTYEACSEKVSDLWLGKIRLHVWRSATLTPFKAVYL